MGAPTAGVLCYHSTGWNVPLVVIVSALVDCDFESAMPLLFSFCLFFVYQEKGRELPHHNCRSVHSSLQYSQFGTMPL